MVVRSPWRQSKEAGVQVEAMFDDDSEETACSESSVSMGLFCGLATGTMTQQDQDDFRSLLDAWSEYSHEERALLRDLMLRDALPPRWAERELVRDLMLRDALPPRCR